MNRRPLVRLALVLGLLAAPALAQERPLETIRLRPPAADQAGKRLQISVRFDGAEQVAQRVQVLEGRPAVIYSNRSRPVRQRIHTPAGVIPQEVTVVHDQATGFQVIPRLRGQAVELEIAAQAGAAHTATTVQAEFGQWIRLRDPYRSEIDGTWLKVEEMPN
jgi:hypothetical protein